MSESLLLSSVGGKSSPLIILLSDLSTHIELCKKALEKTHRTHGEGPIP